MKNDFFGSPLLGDLPRLAAKTHGDNDALITQDRTLSFNEIEELSHRLAGSLSALGIGAGDRVVIHLENGWRWVICYYALAKMGSIIVPANILLSLDELEYVVQDSGAKALIVSESIMDAVNASDQLTQIQLISDNEANGILPSIDGLLLDTDDLNNQNFSVDADDIAMIGYTSGTTGRPKGAVLTHKALTLNAQLTACNHGRTYKDLVYSALPTAHIYGMLILNSALLAGARIAIFPKFDAESAIDFIETQQVTIMDGVPTMYYYLLSSDKIDKANFESLRFCTVGGQAMALPKLQEARDKLGCQIVEAWGMTEIAGIGMSHPMHTPGKVGSIGAPYSFVEARIGGLSDAEDDNRLADEGELFIRGATVMKEYWQNPSATKETLSDDGWFATGDIAYKDEDGYYYIKDRKKEMIITAGYNIYPSEIERVIASHPGVAAVAVAGVQDDKKGEIPYAFIEVKKDHDCTIEEIESLCRRDLSAYKCPRGYKIVEELPRSSTGKILRRKLSELNWSSL